MNSRIITALALAFVLAVPSLASAQVPAEVPVQGFLTDDTGVPVDGTVTIDFKIYDAETGGTELHAETATVDADAGAFTAYLAPDLSVFEENQEIYLALAVNGEDEMSPRLKMATVPYAAVAGNAATVEGMSASDFAPSDYQPHWNDIQNVPADLSDGDDGASYTASGAVQIDSNNELGLITTCPDGNILKWSSSNSQWSCAADDDEDTTYSAGSGVEIDSNNAIGLNSSCSSGQLLKWNGSQWACQADEDTTYLAGAGLQLTSNQFEVDYSSVQQRVSGNCANGEYVVGVNQNGSVVCGTDADTNTTYSAGSGLGLSGTTFAVDTSTIQSRVIGTCASGQKVLGVNQDGSVVCGSDIDTDTDTTYGAGTGLALNATTFSVASGGITSTEIADGTIANADVAGNAAIAPGKIAGTAATLDSSPTFSGTVTASDVKLAAPKTRRAEVFAYDFVIDNPASESDELYYSSAGYVFFLSNSTFPARVDLRAAVELPHGATITEFRCTYFDDYDDTASSEDDLELSVFLNRAKKIGPPGTSSVGNASTSNSVDSLNLQHLIDSTPTNATVDNANYRYLIAVAFTAQSYSFDLQFHGCTIEYAYDTL